MKQAILKLPVISEEPSIYGGGHDREFEKEFLEKMSYFIETYISVAVSSSELNDILSAMLYANEGGYDAYMKNEEI